MIVINGRTSEMPINSFANLEEIIEKALLSETKLDRVITDVKINNENFSEIYPHQAGDISTSELRHVEIVSIPYDQLVLDISEELIKVSQLMINSSKYIAMLFRQAKDTEALELFQDLLDVTRDFMSMLGVIRSEDINNTSFDFLSQIERISELLSEMTEVLENEDWILLSDLLEYEFLPLCTEINEIINLHCKNNKQTVN